MAEYSGGSLEGPLEHIEITDAPLKDVTDLNDATYDGVLAEDIIAEEQDIRDDLPCMPILHEQDDRQPDEVHERVFDIEAARQVALAIEEAHCEVEPFIDGYMHKNKLGQEHRARIEARAAELGRTLDVFERNEVALDLIKEQADLPPEVAEAIEQVRPHVEVAMALEPIMEPLRKQAEMQFEEAWDEVSARLDWQKAVAAHCQGEGYEGLDRMLSYVRKDKTTTVLEMLSAINMLDDTYREAVARADLGDYQRIDRDPLAEWQSEPDLLAKKREWLDDVIDIRSALSLRRFEILGDAYRHITRAVHLGGQLERGDIGAEPLLRRPMYAIERYMLMVEGRLEMRDAEYRAQLSDEPPQVEHGERAKNADINDAQAWVDTRMSCQPQALRRGLKKVDFCAQLPPMIVNGKEVKVSARYGIVENDIQILATTRTPIKQFVHEFGHHAMAETLPISWLIRWNRETKKDVFMTEYVRECKDRRQGINHEDIPECLAFYHDHHHGGVEVLYAEDPARFNLLNEQWKLYNPRRVERIKAVAAKLGPGRVKATWRKTVAAIRQDYDPHQP